MFFYFSEEYFLINKYTLKLVMVVTFANFMVGTLGLIHEVCEMCVRTILNVIKFILNLRKKYRNN